MKIRYLSDLHLEFEKAPAFMPAGDEDLVVLAGDIHIGLEGIRWASQAFDDCPVVYVMGNHEYYRRDYEETLGEARVLAKELGNVHLLEQNYVDVHGVRIAGCTLWTDFDCFGSEQQSSAMWVAWNSLSDYSVIRYRRGMLTPSITRELCLKSRAWLDDAVSSSPLPLVVVTHHAPTMHTFNPRIEPDALTACFHNDWPELVRDPVRAWIHGHNHWCQSKLVNDIPIISNQRGYPREDVGEFDWYRTIDIQLD